MFLSLRIQPIIISYVGNHLFIQILSPKIYYETEEQNEKGVQQSGIIARSLVQPVWYSNCCLTSPVFASHMIAVLSTLPLSKQSPFLFHFNENIGPLCLLSVFLNSPATTHIRICHLNVFISLISIENQNQIFGVGSLLLNTYSKMNYI